MVSQKAYRFKPATVLRFTGEDHFDFLQGQGTADLRGPAGLCRYTLWLDHKGQIKGDGFVLKLDEAAMLLVSYATPVEALMAKFDRHIIADDVEMEDQTNRWELVSRLAESPSEAAPGFIMEGAGYRFPGRRLGRGTVDSLVPAGPVSGLEENRINETAAEQLRVAGGIPAIPADTDTGTVNPVEGNLLSALSFEKGCYLGQEVVARVHRLGRTTRRLVRLSTESRDSSIPEDLHLDDKVVGRVTSVVEFSDKLVALAVLRSRVEDGLHSFSGVRLSVETLPAS